MQDVMWREAGALGRLLESGAIVFVCGDGARMGQGVNRALIEMHVAKSGASASAGEAWMARLGEAGRYVLDFWAGG